MRGAVPALAAALTAATVASAGRAAPNTEPTAAEIQAWLASRNLPSDVSKDDGGPDEPPPDAPRHHGAVVEATVGALGHLGSMRRVSPTAPWFGLLLGYEPATWAMLLLEADLAFTDTSYARRPPEPVPYSLYGFGFGARFTALVGQLVGLYGQASLGGGRIDEDVLGTYGYPKADTVNPYVGARLGVELCAVNPHLSVGAHGGVRYYGDTFNRLRNEEIPLVWLGGAALRYAF